MQLIEIIFISIKYDICVFAMTCNFVFRLRNRNKFQELVIISLILNHCKKIFIMQRYLIKLILRSKRHWLLKLTRGRFLWSYQRSLSKLTYLYRWYWLLIEKLCLLISAHNIHYRLQENEQIIISKIQLLSKNLEESWIKHQLLFIRIINFLSGLIISIHSPQMIWILQILALLLIIHN